MEGLPALAIIKMYEKSILKILFASFTSTSGSIRIRTGSELPKSYIRIRIWIIRIRSTGQGQYSIISNCVCKTLAVPICFLFCVRFDHKHIIYQEKYEYTVVYTVVYIIRKKNLFMKQNKKAG